MSSTPGRAQTPLKSGLPLGSRGAGAFMSTLARADSAAAVGLSATRRAIAQTDVLMTELLSVDRRADYGLGGRTVQLCTGMVLGPWCLVLGPSSVLSPSLVLGALGHTRSCCARW